MLLNRLKDWNTMPTLERYAGALTPAARHIGAVVEDLAAAGGLQQVDAPQKRGLAGAGRADDGDDIALFDIEIDVPQDLVGAEGLAQVADL